MKLSNFTLIVTDNCNRSCSYCPQTREKKSISQRTVHRALEFFFPFMENESVISFYGGEPLLEFKIIKETVEWIRNRCRKPLNDKSKKHIDFSLTTNGSLLTPEILEFLNHNQFSMLLSFDGLAHELSRGKNDFDTLVELIKTISKSYPEIKLKTNSIFTPETISFMAESVRFLSELGVRNKFSLSKSEGWKEEKLEEYEKQLKDVTDFAFLEYKKNGPILVENLKGNISPPFEALFVCSGCRKRIAISPEGNLWGCFLFHDYFKNKKKTDEYGKYFLGHLEDFINNHVTLWPEKCANYSRLRIDNAWTPDTYCFSCEYVYRCNICPVAAAYSERGDEDLYYIPFAMCQICKITTRIKDIFFQRIQHSID